MEAIFLPSLSRYHIVGVHRGSAAHGGTFLVGETISEEADVTGGALVLLTLGCGTWVWSRLAWPAKDETASYTLLVIAARIPAMF